MCGGVKNNHNGRTNQSLSSCLNHYFSVTHLEMLKCSGIEKHTLYWIRSGNAFVFPKEEQQCKVLLVCNITLCQRITELWEVFCCQISLLRNNTAGSFSVTKLIGSLMMCKSTVWSLIFSKLNFHNPSLPILQFNTKKLKETSHSLSIFFFSCCHSSVKPTDPSSAYLSLYRYAPKRT